MSARTLAIAGKEVRHLLRDPRSLIIIFLMPVLMLFLYGYAINLDVRDVPVCVWDRCDTQESGELIRRFVQSGYFVVTGYADGRDQIEKLIDQRKAKAGIVIPRDFGKRPGSLQDIQVLLDGSDPTTANVITNYLQMILATPGGGRDPTPPVLDIRPRVWYNQELKSVNYIVPGLTAILLMMVSALLTSLAVVREWESGTMERLLTSPVRTWEIIIGKILPYVVLALLIGLLILGVGRFHFGVPFNGNPALLIFGLVVYLFSGLSFGLLVSTLVRTQLLATMVALMATVLPLVMLSGFLFPIPSLPRALQFVTMLVPARYFLLIIRGIVLKGIGLKYLWPQWLFLSAMGLALSAASIARFKAKVKKGLEDQG